MNVSFVLLQGPCWQQSMWKAVWSCLSRKVKTQSFMFLSKCFNCQFIKTFFYSSHLQKWTFIILCTPFSFIILPVNYRCLCMASAVCCILQCGPVQWCELYHTLSGPCGTCYGPLWSQYDGADWGEGPSHLHPKIVLPSMSKYRRVLQRM